MRDLVSSLDEIIVEGGRIIVWEQDLPTLAVLMEIKLRHSMLPKEGKGVVLWGDLRSPSKIKNFLRRSSALSKANTTMSVMIYGITRPDPSLE